MTPALSRLQTLVDDVAASARERVAAMPPDLQMTLFRHLSDEYKRAIATNDKTREIELAFAVIGYASTVTNMLEVEEAEA